LVGIPYLVMPTLVAGIHVFFVGPKAWMAGTSPRLSGLIFVDVAHGMDSSVF
jgi:hypothetical protein